jgi:hypothetical protein
MVRGAGCLACFNAGTQPDRWRAIFAGIPAGDFVASSLGIGSRAAGVGRGGVRRLARAGARTRTPEAIPMTYVDAVRAPVLVIAGEADPAARSKA